MLSPQIYIAKFDKSLTFNTLDYTSHKASSLVMAGTEAKAQKRNKNEDERGETHRTGAREAKEKKGAKKGARNGEDKLEKR